MALHLLFDAWERVTRFGRTPVPRGAPVYRLVGIWLRATCWTLAALVGLSFLASLALLVVAATFGDLAGWEGALVALYLVAVAVFLSVVFAMSVGVGMLMAFLYGGWVERDRSALWGVRSLALVVAFLGGAAVALGFSPWALWLAAALVGASGLAVFGLTFHDSLRNEFSSMP